MFNFLTNRSRRQQAALEPLVLTTSHRRELINKAMTGASVAEQLTLVNYAFNKLSLTEKNNLVRKWDRDQWAEMKP